MKEQYILAVDQSTSGTKAILFDRNGDLIKRATFDHTQYYPQAGWVEHDPEEIYTNTQMAIRQVLMESGVCESEIASLAISNQRETVVVWDKSTGKPIYPAIVWQCGRAAGICRTLEEKGHGAMVKEKTGLVLSPYFSAAKINWILDYVPGAREKAEAGQLLFGTMDSWLVWNLTGGKVHATDYSNASRTQLFNIMDLGWDEELLRIFTIPQSMAPEVKYSDELFGHAGDAAGFSRDIPIAGVMGDSHAALFGQHCFEPGMAKATYGTGSSVMMHIGRQKRASQKGLVTSLAWGMGGQVEYVFEGNINCAGAAIKWLADGLHLIPDSRSAGAIAASVPDNGGVYMVPAFTGLGAPYWGNNAKASIWGMTLGANKAHIVRAAEESIAYQIKDILDLMVAESGATLKELRVDGGPTRDDFLMQFQADIAAVRVVRGKVAELSALGAAFMAGLAVGIWSTKESMQTLRREDKAYECQMGAIERAQLYGGWVAAVRRTLTDY